jgi:hypothetical protein
LLFGVFVRTRTAGRRGAGTNADSTCVFHDVQSGSAGARPNYTDVMTHPVLALKHLPSHDNHLCSGCGAEFVPSEDSGSRLLSLRGPDTAFSALLCGGCHSKWSHGSPITLKGPLPA